MLSLSPRSDTFRFVLPKDFLPAPVQEKYAKIIAKNAGVIQTPIDYLNESIQGVSFPGIQDIVMQQQQHSSNTIIRTANPRRINVEPKVDINYVTPGNPLDKIDKTFKISFRKNQGLYNYFMLYESIFYRICKPELYPADKLLTVDILGEKGNVVSQILYKDCFIDGIEGLDFSYNKVERDVSTFDITIKFNNIDFEILE